MTTEVKEEQPIPTTTEPEPEAPPLEEAKEDIKEPVVEAKTTTNGATNGNGKEAEPEHEEAEPMETETNGHDATDNKPSEPISELAASVKQRQRKKVERFLPALPQSEDRTKELVIPKGQGTKLGELDNVEFRITRTEAEDLKPLHRVIFGTAGKVLTVRKNLRAFQGFDFEKTSPQYEKKMDGIRRFTSKGIKFVLQLLDLETKGERPELEQRLMDFLMNPQPSGRKSVKEAAKEAQEKKKKSSERKKAAAEKKKAKLERKKVAAEKKKAKQESKKKPKAKSPQKKTDGEAKGKKRPAPSDEEEEEESESEKESESESESESGSESDSSTSSSASSKSSSSSAPTPSPSPPKKAKPAPAKKASPVKSPPAKKAPAKATKSPAQPAKSSSPANNGEPTDDELHTIISDFVSGADLETVTMKNVIAHVFSKFPSLDLTNRKPWIKETVKQLVAAAP